MALTRFLPDINFQQSDKALLRNLMWLRFFEILGLFFVGLSSHYLFKLEVPVLPFLFTLAFLIVGNLFVLFRLKVSWPVTQAELFLNLLADCIILTIFMSYTGGASNPFISLYLVLIAVSASTLALRYTIAITLACAAMYSFLIISQPSHHLHQDDFQLHMLGMWINFLLGSLCLLVFMSLLRRALTEREKLINQNKEQALRNEHILALGSMAAGAAHELSTPLSTVNLLTESLIAQETDENRKQDLQLIQQQIALCKQTINSLRQSADETNNLSSRQDNLKNHLETIFDKWLLLWPNTEEKISYYQTFENPSLLFEKRLQQTLLSILNNASEASRQNNSNKVFVNIDYNNTILKIWIYDEGSGIDESTKVAASKMVLSTKRKGYGLGLMLSRSNIEQLGGKIVLSNETHPDSHSKTGACCYIELTLK
jgi:two-component system sensor histidine kinase RegB